MTFGSPPVEIDPPSRVWRVAVGGVLVLAVLLAADGRVSGAADRPLASSLDSREGVAVFERRIRPLLVQRCYECHSEQAKTIQGGLRLDTRGGLLAGGDSGPLIVPGDPDASMLIQTIRHEHEAFEMPPAGPLPPEEIRLLSEWVRSGAPMPAETSPPPALSAGIDFATGRQFWSFQPLARHMAPRVSRPDWVERPIDAFVLAELDQRSLAPASTAARRVLIRRLYFDLLGIPPTPAAVERFEADADPQAYSRLVEELLASPHYGERWGRYWLDLARYSDATASWLSSVAQAWLYRDWVVDAINEDVPYDDFVRRQLATDSLAETGPEDIPALGFLGLSPAYWKELKLDKEVIKGTVAEEWEERVDTIGRTFLGLTIACARCHDHKFDPISTEDYYALAGVLASTRLVDRPIIPEDAARRVEEARAQVQAWQGELTKLREATPPAAESDQRIGALEREIAALEAGTPHYHSPRAHAIDDAALYVVADGPHATKLEHRPGEPRDLHVHIRGNPSNLGPLTPRRFLTVLCPEPPQPFTAGSGRPELAESLVTTAAPLAARVMVNRVWQHHFGRGLVETVSDFGAQGARPTHPELLDDLSARFVDHGWSLKWLHREILLSATYQQSSTYDAAAHALDPENRWLWRMTRRRLEIEAWRDAMLSVSGTLDRQLGGPAIDLADPAHQRRTLYGSIRRYELNDMLRLYDFPDPLSHSPSRTPTITPLQQLFVLNGPFLQQQAAALARRIAAESPPQSEAQIRHAYRVLFHRSPTAAELQLGIDFLTLHDNGTTKPDRWPRYAQALLASNEFLFID